MKINNIRNEIPLTPDFPTFTPPYFSEVEGKSSHSPRASQRRLRTENHPAATNLQQLFEVQNRQQPLQLQIEDAIENGQFEKALTLIDKLESSADPKIFNIFGNLVKATCLNMLDRPKEAFLCCKKAIEAVATEANEFKKRCIEEIYRLHKEGYFKTSEDKELEWRISFIDKTIDKWVSLTDYMILQRNSEQFDPFVCKHQAINDFTPLRDEENIDSIFKLSASKDYEDFFDLAVTMSYTSIASSGLKIEVSIDIR